MKKTEPDMGMPICIYLNAEEADQYADHGVIMPENMDGLFKYNLDKPKPDQALEALIKPLLPSGSCDENIKIKERNLVIRECISALTAAPVSEVVHAPYCELTFPRGHKGECTCQERQLSSPAVSDDERAAALEDFPVYGEGELDDWFKRNQNVLRKLLEAKQ